MKGTEVVFKNCGAPQENELEAINRYTRRAFTEKELYAFSVALCDNEIDRDFERFTPEALEGLGKLFVGKTGIFNHSTRTQDQAARIYACHVEEEPGRVTEAGEPYRRLVARAYLPRCEKNADFILELESGMKKEVSVGCAVGHVTCSVCGADFRMGGCAHEKGKSYGGVICHAVLDEPTDAYEWSFVAVPAQREAGVMKHYGGSGTEDAEQKRYAEYGRRWRAELEESVVKLCAAAEPGLAAEVMRRAASRMEPDDLLAFQKVFRARAEDVFPLTAQLGGIPPAGQEDNGAFRVI